MHDLTTSTFVPFLYSKKVNDSHVSRVETRQGTALAVDRAAGSRSSLRRARVRDQTIGR
jgi:hypothetical protein